jgi:hypothetical protein
MTRRLFAFLPVLLLADEASDAWDVIAAMAAALAEDNADGFLKRIDPKMVGYGDLSTNVTALIQQADVRSAISPIANEGDASARTLQLDWELHLKPKGNNVHSVSREEAITVQLDRLNTKWRITKLEPVAFFAPPQF